MTNLREVYRHVRGIGQKLTADNFHNLGQKAMRTAHTIGRKASNTLHKIEQFGQKALPLVSAVASAAGFPELGGALYSANHGLKRIANARGRVDAVRNVFEQ